MWKKEKVLITVKTYPNLSNAYEELVCTAGIREDGSWIRLYPIPFRHMDYDRQFKKYQWVEVQTRRRSQDMRPESYEPRCDTFQMGEFIGTQGNWRERKKHVLRQVHTDLGDLIKEAHENQLSLAVYKPAKFLDFKAEFVLDSERAEYQGKIEGNSWIWWMVLRTRSGWRTSRITVFTTSSRISTGGGARCR